MVFEDRLYPVLLSVPEACRSLKGSEKVRFLKKHARKALELSSKRSGLILEKPEKAKSGAPISAHGIYWSVSHKEALVCAVVAPVPVGIDVEQIRPRNEALLNRIADEKERQLAAGNRTVLFFRFWTAKEAVLKAVGDGLSGLSGCRIVAVHGDAHLTVVYRKKHWEVEHHFYQGHIASITCGPFPIFWVIAESTSP